MITDHDREDLLPSFWNMNWGQRKVYVCSMVTSHSVARRAASHGTTRRNLTMKYHFRVKGETIQVIVFIIYVLSYICISVTVIVYSINIYVI